jgi:hypothetical protein
MSISAVASAEADDFDRWEDEFSPRRRPTKAARRRQDDEAIEHGLGIFRHRTGERREG